MLINKISPLWSFIFFDNDGGGNDGESEPSKEQGFQKRLKAFNDNATDLAMSLWEDNFRFRRKNQDLTSKLEEANKKIPTEGQVVLTPEQAKQWVAYQALGTPEEAKTKVEERDQLQGKLGTLERDSILQRAAMIAGYDVDVLKEVDALATQVGGKKLSYSVREIDKDGAKVQAAFVKEGDNETPLADYAQANWAKHLPSLAVQKERGSSNGSQATGQYYPPQHQGSGGNNSSQAKSPKAQVEARLNSKYPSPASQDKKT